MRPTFRKDTQHLIQLIDRMDATRNKIAKKLNTLALTNLFGEGSFNHPLTSPCEGIVNNIRPDGKIATGIQQAWSHLTIKIQEVVLLGQVIDTSHYLIKQPVTRADFYEDGSMDGSGTNAIMIKLEKQRSIHLRTIIESSLDKGEYEKWS